MNGKVRQAQGTGSLGIGRGKEGLEGERGDLSGDLLPGLAKKRQRCNYINSTSYGSLAMAIISMGRERRKSEQRAVGTARTAQFGTGHRVEWTGCTPDAPQARPSLAQGPPWNGSTAQSADISQALTTARHIVAVRVGEMVKVERP